MTANRIYFTETETLRFIYLFGKMCDYLKVPAEVYEKMKNAFSKGIFLNTRIQGKFELSVLISKNRF